GDRLILHYRLCSRVEIRLGKPRPQDRLDWQRYLPPLQSFIEAAVEIAADHSLDWDHLEPPHDHPVRILDPEHMMRHLEIVKPERRQLTQDLALPRDRRRQHHIVRGDPVREDEQQLIMSEVVDVLDLSTLERD